MKKELLLKICVFCQFLCVLACTNNLKNKNEKIDGDMTNGTFNDTLQDTLISWSKKELRMEGLSIVSDTLKFVTPSKQIYYPLGKFIKTEDLIINFPMLKLSKEGSYSSEGIFRFVFDHSYIKFFKDEETGNLEIVYAAIIDPGIKFTNDIEVGISSRQFYDKFFNKVVTEQGTGC